MTDAEALKALKDEWVANPSRRHQIQERIERLEEEMRIQRDRFLADWDEADKRDRELEDAKAREYDSENGFELDWERDLRDRQKRAWERQRHSFVVPGHREQPNGHGGITLQGIPEAITPLHWGSGWRIHKTS